MRVVPPSARQDRRTAGAGFVDPALDPTRHFFVYESADIGRGLRRIAELQGLNFTVCEGAIWERAYKGIDRRLCILSAPVRRHQP